MKLKPAISINKLSKRYEKDNGLWALKDLDLHVQYGEILALLGSNGAGKTTTLNCLAGFLHPTYGQIELAGMNHHDHYMPIREKVGYLTLGMKLYDKFSIFESLTFLGELRLIPKEKLAVRIETLAEQFKLKDFLYKRFEELSSGQQQRSLIASTLIHDPQILIFDEITASLDMLLCREIMDYLLSEKEKGKAIIFSTHKLSEVEYLSNRVAILHKGKLMENCQVHELGQKHSANNLLEAFCNAVESYQKAA